MNTWLPIFLAVVHKKLEPSFVKTPHRNRSVLQLHRVNRLTTDCERSQAAPCAMLLHFGGTSLCFPGLPQAKIDKKSHSAKGGQCRNQVRLEAQFLHQVASIA